MKIINRASAGSLESSDLLVTVEPSDFLTLEIESPVKAQYGDQIKELCLGLLEEMGIDTGKILLQDQGALDCTIRARLKTALLRSQSEEN